MSVEKVKMLRSVLDRQQHGDLGETMENASTPLHGGNIGYPRIRLMDKHTKLTKISLYSLSPSKQTPGVPSVVRDNVTTTRPEKWFPPHVQQRQTCQSDRFIPWRRHQNFAASNYFLTKVPPRVENQNRLDVFDQVDVSVIGHLPIMVSVCFDYNKIHIIIAQPTMTGTSTLFIYLFKPIFNLETTWRKSLMKSAMEKSNLLPNEGHQRVLSIGKPLGLNRGNYRGVEGRIDDSSTDGVWKIRARKKPLIGLTDIIAEVPTLSHNWRRGLLDWGATNFIAAMIGTAIVIFDGRSKLAITRPGRVLDDITTKTRAIKWNNAGTMIAICTAASEIMIHHFITQKYLWCRECRCTIEKPEVACEVLCVAWTHTDTEIVIGCTEGRISSYNVSLGTMIDTIFAHADMILAVAFSPTDRYLVSTSVDKAVRIHTWPSLTPHLAIGYYEPVQALAWHPWEVDMLCVGGGFEDGSLSLWDIHRQTSLGYRKIPFLGVVKNMTWNKLSGELVVQWNYQHGDSVRAAVPVLASLDRVVDLVSMAPRFMDIVWNPDGTQLAMRMKNCVKVWNFFGNETSNWYDEKKKSILSKGKSIMSAGGKRNFENYSIR